MKREAQSEIGSTKRECEARSTNHLSNRSVKPFLVSSIKQFRQTVPLNHKCFWKRRGLNSWPPAPQSNAITIRPWCPLLYFNSNVNLPYIIFVSATQRPRWTKGLKICSEMQQKIIWWSGKCRKGLRIQIACQALGTGKNLFKSTPPWLSGLSERSFLGTF